MNRDAPSYIGIVFNGFPLFTGEAGSGESQIRRTIEGSEDTILRQFAAWKETESIRIFPSTDFGYRRIQIARPLRLNFEVSDERLVRLQSAKTFADLASSTKKDKTFREVEILAGRELLAALLAALSSLPKAMVECRAKFEERIEKALKTAGLKPKKPVIKSILEMLKEVMG